MGIKTKFNPMGGQRGEKDLGNLALWRYSNEVISGKTLLYNYTGDWYGTLYVPGFAYTQEGTSDNYYLLGYSPVKDQTIYYSNGTPTNNVVNRIYNYSYFSSAPYTRNYVRNSAGDMQIPTNGGRYAYSLEGYGEYIGYINEYPPRDGLYVYQANGVLVTSDPIEGVINSNAFQLGGVIFKRMASEDIKGDPVTLYVPKAKGKAIINDWYIVETSGTTDANRNTPFFNNPNVTSVDLQGVPFRNNNMYKAFNNCRNLIAANNIPNSVTNMDSTFYECFNLKQNIQIPNSVTSMASTFYDCFNLNQNIQIPNSVTNMYATFYYCNTLNQNIKIPNSVTNMSSTFSYCQNLNQNIQIPNSVTSMSSTFYYCGNFDQNIQIPDSVTSMTHTFYDCFNLKQNIQIPNSVTNMVYTFYYCNNLNQNIQIPNSVTNMSSTFSYCNNLNQNIKISNSVTSMSLTFSQCQKLNQNIQIPSSVTNMSSTFASTRMSSAYWKMGNRAGRKV